jgi:tRNA pseudouridine55 synthase
MLHGFLLVDKEKGINSFKLVVALRRLANQKRVGYAGTLDPLASGLMVLALGEYTKLLPYLEASDKTYLVEALLGKTSDTYDTEGLLEDGPDPDRVPLQQEIEQLLREKFSGKIMQVPPRHSAIKIEGRRAYDLARQGEQFELKARPVEIFGCRILSYDYPVLKMEVHCSSGTYVRSLVHDLGQYLGCGAVVSGLRRTSIGILSMGSPKVDRAIKKLEQLDAGQLEQQLADSRDVLAGLPHCELSEEEYAVLARGNFVENRWRSEGQGKALPTAAIAFWQNRPVGVLTDAAGQGADFFSAEKLKFCRKLNIF